VYAHHSSHPNHGQLRCSLIRVLRAQSGGSKGKSIHADLPAASHSLIITETLRVTTVVSTAEAEGEIIATALASSARAEGFEYHIRDTLASEDIATNHGRFVRWRKQAVVR